MMIPAQLLFRTSDLINGLLAFSTWMFYRDVSHEMFKIIDSQSLKHLSQSLTILVNGITQ